MGNVYGGYSTSGSATNNEVVISDGSSITGNVYGGYSGATSGVDVTSGNTLTVESASTSFAHAYNFEKIDLQGQGTSEEYSYSFGVGVSNAGSDLTTEISADSGKTFTLSGAIEGDGLGIVKTGEGMVVLSGENSYSGVTYIQEGMLKLDNIGAMSESGLEAGDYVIEKGAALVLGNLGPNAEHKFTKSISGDGDVIVAENGYVNIDIRYGNEPQLGNYYTGSTIILAGATLNVGEERAFSKTREDGTGGDYQLVDESSTFVIDMADWEDLPVGEVSNKISGPGTLVLDITDATQVLSGDLTEHTGVTKIYIPEYDSGPDHFKPTHATLVLATQQSVSSGSYELVDGSTFELAFEGSFGQPISGEEGSTLSINPTSGTLSLTQAQENFSGDTVVKSGTLRIENALAAGTSQNAISMAEGTSLVLAYAGEFSRGVTTTGANVNLVVDAAAEPSAAAVSYASVLRAATTFSAANAITLAANDATAGTTTNAADTLYLTASMDDYDGMVTVLSGTLVAGQNTLASTTGLTLYGGASFTPAESYSLANKVLNVRTSETGESATIDGNLDAQGATINYEGQLDSETPMLVVTGDANISESSYSVKLVGEDEFTPGTSIQVLAVEGELVAENVQAESVSYGVTLESQVAVDVEEVLVDEQGLLNVVVLNYEEPTVRSESKVLLEGSLAAATLVTQGADMVAGRGIEAARAATKETQPMTFTPFAAVQGGSMRYNSDSHIDTRSLNLMAGIALGSNTSAGDLTFGAFFEYGTGSYNTHNSFTNGSLDGDGNAYYVGWGLLGRWDFLNTGPGHFYVEASGHMGGLYNSYENDDLRDRFESRSDYDRYNAYYSFHAGLGYVFDFAERAHLDVYGKYFWTRVDGESLTLSEETIDFEDVTSSRLRFGARFSYDVNELVKPYIGAAWEHEFDGKARGSAWVDGYGGDISSPSLKGDTGIGEIGISLTPSEEIPFTLDVAVQGYVGKREGVTGSVLFKYTF